MSPQWFTPFIALCVGASVLPAQPAFLRKDVPFSVDNFFGQAFAGDFNGDRRPDLAVCSGYRRLTIQFNSGGGNFARPVVAEVDQQICGRDFPIVVDVNGDGRDDLLTRGGILLSRGDGTFVPGSQFSGDIVAAAGDFNGDGKADLIVAQASGGSAVWLGNGDGAFRRTADFTPLGAARVLAADFNHDGRSDVLLDLGGEVAVFLGKGEGTFGPEVRTRLRSMLRTMPVADVNGDGVPDLVVEGGIAMGKGDGSFQPLVPYPGLGTDIYCLAAADFTGDGKADLVVSPGKTNSVLFLPGKGDGTFLAPIEQSVGWGVYDPAIAADLDGDGRLDLVTSNYSSNTLTILFNRAHTEPGLRRAVSAASDSAIVAPESLATMYVPTGASTTAASPPWPTKLGGISLEVRDSAGAARLAPLLFVSPTQINFQVPADTALGEATLAVVSEGVRTLAGGTQVEAVTPGIFVLSHAESVPAATAVLVQPDGTQVPIPVFDCARSAEALSCKLSSMPLSSAGNGRIYVTFYGTGFRGVNAANVTCSIGGIPVPVTYAGPQGIPGLDQINIRLLPFEQLENLVYNVVIAIDGVMANQPFIDFH
ncbi:MAG: FG-GAP-like repeat-containing protein [Acidobacteriia bacterium]|nr:FG-GAP-like repeat-containing protein [Terriglobia bacterium]